MKRGGYSIRKSIISMTTLLIAFGLITCALTFFVSKKLMTNQRLIKNEGAIAQIIVELKWNVAQAADALKGVMLNPTIDAELKNYEKSAERLMTTLGNIKPLLAQEAHQKLLADLQKFATDNLHILEKELINDKIGYAKKFNDDIWLGSGTYEQAK